MYFNHETSCSRIPIYVKEGEYTIEFELAENHPFLHLKIDKLTKSIVQDAPSIVEDISRFLGTMGYPMVFALVPYDRSALHKLYVKLGFSKLTDWEGHQIYVINIKEPEDYSDITLTPSEMNAAREKAREVGYDQWV